MANKTYSYSGRGGLTAGELYFLRAERIQGLGSAFRIKAAGRKLVGVELSLSNGSTLKWGCHRSRIRLILLVRDCIKYSAECFKSVTCRTYFP